ncbi:MAG: precorrin-3B C(17)-methyltransferase [Parvibaculaceae bacterium]
MNGAGSAKRPVVVHLRAGSEALARDVAAAIDGDLHCSIGNVADALRAFFQGGRPIVGIMSSGILVRALAPLIAEKQEEPPVLSVAWDGSAVIPLLGGHRGGNALAGRIAETIGAFPAVSTASDLAHGVALDDPPKGYVLRNIEHYKSFAARVLDGEPVRITGDAPWLSALPQSPDGDLEIVVTDREIEGSPTRLVYHTATLAIGVGCERGTERHEVQGLIEKSLERHGLSWHGVGGIASIDVKADEPAMVELGYFRFFPADELNAVTGRVKNPSEIVRREVGTPSVAEAAALCAAGPDGELIVEKTKSARATCAIARAPEPIVEQRGRARGALRVVGLGPGSEAMRSPEATHALSGATDWVGYGLYLDLASDLRTHQTEHRFPLGAEEERVIHALELAGRGKDVALLCSGDAGIYAMAALALEVLDPDSGAKLSDAARRVEVSVVPGISAFQMAAARAGGFIGHDFCCISLSDLLTPWEAIETRIRGAAEGDFVVAFYNPRSLKRADHLDRAMAILKEHRPADTPVVVASNLGRSDEKVGIVPLRSFDAGVIDMLTIVLVGSSQSRSFARGDGTVRAYTPRGYARKRGASA